MKNEPLVTAGAVVAAVSALLTLLVAFGVHLGKDQTAAILGLVSVLAPIAVALFARSKVTPVNRS